MTRYANELDRVATLRRARGHSAEAARIARLRYQAGRENFQVVLEAERALAQTEAALAQAEALLSTYQIAVFLSLGGGWERAAGQTAMPRDLFLGVARLLATPQVLQGERKGAARWLPPYRRPQR